MSASASLLNLRLRQGCALAVLMAGLGLPAAGVAQEPPGEAGDAPVLRDSVEPGEALRGGTLDPFRELPGDDVRPDTSRTRPNFGRRRPLPDKREAYPGRRREAPRPLPRTEAYRTAPGTVRGAYSAPPAPPPPTPYAQPAQIPRPARPRVEENPYQPLGIDVGSLRLRPFIETSVGSDSNANRTAAGARAATFTRLDAGFTALSNWSVHEFRADVRGGYSKFFGVNGADRPDGAARFNLRIDATRNTRFDFELRGALTTQRPG